MYGCSQVHFSVAFISKYHASTGHASRQRLVKGGLDGIVWQTRYVSKKNESNGLVAFDLEYYTEVQDLHQLLPLLNQDVRLKKFAQLNAALVDMIENFNLIGFYPLYIEDRDCMLNIARAIDKANGFVFGGLDENDAIHGAANRVGGLEDVSWIAEKYLGHGLEEDSESESSEHSEVDMDILSEEWKQEMMDIVDDPSVFGKRTTILLD